MLKFTIEQFNAWRSLVFVIGIAVGAGIGVCVVTLARVLVGKYD